MSEPEILSFDDNRHERLYPPVVPAPTRPTVVISPVQPTADDDLTCVISVPSESWNPVTYEFRWFRDGSYAKEVGNQSVVQGEDTHLGETWRCDVVAQGGDQRASVVSSPSTQIP